MILGCSKSYIQIFETQSSNTKFTNEYYIYETDTLKITYTFWASKGVMSFAVYNKLDKPIYIDWKNSSFIRNDNKLNYWIEETHTNLASYYGAYFYNGPLLKPGYMLNEGVQNSAATTIKPERITFIPPKSNYYRSQFYLTSVDYYSIDKNCQSTVVTSNENPKKKTTIYNQDFSYSASPLRFRNYLAFAFEENSKQYFFVDNEFYLTSVKEMELSQYRGKNIGFDKTWLVPIYDKSPFQKSNSFFINIPQNTNVGYRKHNFNN